MFSFAAVGALLCATLALSAPASPPSTPQGGVGLEQFPSYTITSDFDFASVNLALNQEYIELDLFHHILAVFSEDEFKAAGLDAEDLFLIEYMADQEAGHAILLSNMLGPTAAKQCNYTYPFDSVRDAIDFCQKLTRFGESGVYGFLEHLDNRASAELLLQSITTEARQQMVFRQFEGLFPMPVYFETGITQSMAWTLLSQYISHCPAENPRIQWQNFPGLYIANDPTQGALALEVTPAITHNLSVPLTTPGQQVDLIWEDSGKAVGPDGLYTTTTTAGGPKYAAWIAQLNITYTPLFNITHNFASTHQPIGDVFGPNTAPIVNDTIFVLITDDNPHVTPANLSLLNAHVVAGPAIYQAG
ncbi:Rds1 protein [Neolentinus lepideus HHB14362 ss-1]|uniref:Rds1 protein n=1 Tax=Neolentinus lepideus HHB14362 ss-1 TaxID=1314782 RepID=A0A165V1V4_9AGAM|nr:Rds1 protein [Neolentinus lepideus HHB14362 ss-1]